MEGVQEVNQLGEDRLRWRAQIAGIDKEWYARIVEQIPDEMIAWHSETGTVIGGAVSFKPIDHAMTLVTAATRQAQ